MNILYSALLPVNQRRANGGKSWAACNGEWDELGPIWGQEGEALSGCHVHQNFLPFFWPDLQESLRTYAWKRTGSGPRRATGDMSSYREVSKKDFYLHLLGHLVTTIAWLGIGLDP